MGLTLSQVLTLIGPLDDSPGFDSPRERFRRFLTESILDLPTARALIEDGQHLIGEQQHRALQDAVVLLGRFLGFETTFGTYQRSNGGVKYDGHWRSRRRLHIVLQIRTDLTPKTDFDDLSRSLAALTTEPSLDLDVPRLGLCVVTPLFAARARLEQAPLADRRNHERRIVSIGSLLWLAEMVTAGRVTHDEVVKLLSSGLGLDFVVELLERVSSGVANGAAVHTVAPDIAEPESDRVHAAVPNTAKPESDFWTATIERSQAATFQKMVESAVGHRHVLGVAEDGAFPGVARPGDWICFFAPGKGVVGHAQVSTTEDADAHLLRGSDRFSQLYRLKNVELFDTPIIPEPELELTLIAEQERASTSGPVLVPVSRNAFHVLTGQYPVGRSDDLRPKAARLEPDRAGTIERASRLRG